MRRTGLVVWGAHQLAASMVRPGVTTGEIDKAVEIGRRAAEENLDAIRELVEGLPAAEGPGDPLRWPPGPS